MQSERVLSPTDRELNAIVFKLQARLDAASGSVGFEDALIQQPYVIEGGHVDVGSEVGLATFDLGPMSAWKVTNAPTIEASRPISISMEEPPTLTSVLSEDLSIWAFKIPSTATPSSTEHKTKFQELMDEWRSQTAFSSSLIEIVMIPAYQRIIGMGRTAIPLILQELFRQPDHWFWALKAITGEDPVPEQDQGDMVKMTSAWLAWGTTSGYEI